MSDISKRLTKYRKAAKLSQEEVADKLGVSRQTVSKWETGQSTPDFDKIAPLCELYNISTDELLRGVVEPKKEEPEKERDDDGDKDDEDDDEKHCKKCAKSPSSVIVGGIFSILSIFTLIIYLSVSFATGAWHITWIIWLLYAVLVTIIKIILAIFGVSVDDDCVSETKKPSYGLRIFGLIMALFCLLLVISFVGVLFVNPGGMFFGINKGYSDRNIYDETYEVDFKTLDINSKAGKIDVKESDDNNMRVMIYSDESKNYEIGKNNDVFKINVENDGCRGIACFDYKMPRIEVYLPENYAEKIEIKNNYGDITVGEFENATMVIDEDYGEAKIGAVKNLELKNSMGATKIDKILGSAKIENSMGAIKIEELAITENSTIENSMGSINIKKTNDIYIDAKADMGSANISKNNRESKIELRVRCSMGSINID